MTSERVKDGLKAAKARGRSGGRPSKANAHTDAVMVLCKGGMHVSDIAKHEGISRTTVYKTIGEHEEGWELRKAISTAGFVDGYIQGYGKYYLFEAFWDNRPWTMPSIPHMRPC